MSQAGVTIYIYSGTLGSLILYRLAMRMALRWIKSLICIQRSFSNWRGSMEWT